VTTYLLDTNACVECLRNRNAGVVARFQSCSPRELRLCSVVVAELCYGAYKSPKPAANLTLVQTFATPLISVPFDDLAADVYGRIRADLDVHAHHGGRFYEPFSPEKAREYGSDTLRGCKGSQQLFARTRQDVLMSGSGGSEDAASLA